MLQLAIENEIYSLFQVLGTEADMLLLDFDLFEDWLNTRSHIITGFIIGKHLTMDFEFTEEFSNEELFKRLKALRNKGE